MTAEQQAEELERLLEAQEVEYTPDVEDPWSSAPPVPDGTHHCVIELGRDGTSLGQLKADGDSDAADAQRTGMIYIKVPLVLKIVAPGEPWDGQLVYDRVNTIISRRTNTSDVHEILKAVGDPAPARMNGARLREHIEQAFAEASNAQCKVTTQWTAQVEEPDPKDKNKTRYRTVKTGMKRFPPKYDESGKTIVGYEPEIEDKPTGQMARAQAKPIRYDPLG